MEHRQIGGGDGDDRREVIQYSSVPRFNNASDVHVTNTNSGFNGGTGTYPNMMMPQQTRRQRLPNGYNRYGHGRSHAYGCYESGYPYFAPNFSNNPIHYARPAQSAAINVDININGFGGVSIMNMRGDYSNANTAPVSSYSYYNNGTRSYQLQSAGQRPPLQTPHFQPAERFDSRGNGRVGGGRMERRPPTFTTMEILDEDICIGPRYSRIREQRTLGGGVPDEYNLPEFITEYEVAKYFVIKSSSKEHLLRSIRHGVWTSTRRGNHILDAAYAETHGEQNNQGVGNSTASPCGHVFLIFSVSFFIFIIFKYILFFFFLLNLTILRILYNLKNMN